MGLVYLVHLDRPYHHARHYVGWSGGRILVAQRMAHHAAGRGSRFLAAVTRAGIGWQVTKVWWGQDRTFERRIKNGKNAARHCPVCQGRRSRLRAAHWFEGQRVARHRGVLEAAGRFSFVVLAATGSSGSSPESVRVEAVERGHLEPVASTT